MKNELSSVKTIRKVIYTELESGTCIASEYGNYCMHCIFSASLQKSASALCGQGQSRIAQSSPDIFNTTVQSTQWK